MTRGGGTPSTIRCEKSASFVTIAKSFRCAWPKSWDSVGREPRSKACVTGRPVCRVGTRGRFSSKRKPLMPHVRASIGCPSTAPRDPHRPVPVHDGAKETPPARPPRNPPPPASPARTERRCAFHAAQAGRCTPQDESRSSQNSWVKVSPDPGCRQGGYWSISCSRTLLCVAQHRRQQARGRAGVQERVKPLLIYQRALRHRTRSEALFFAGQQYQAGQLPVAKDLPSPRGSVSVVLKKNRAS